MYFNSQPREGGWSIGLPMSLSIMFISTHSRAKAAGYSPPKTAIAYAYFNSQPREGGWVVELLKSGGNDISTHSRPKAAGIAANRCRWGTIDFNSQPPEGGWASINDC